MTTHLRRSLAVVLAASAFSGLFVLAYGYALHSPRPHGLRVEVVGPPAAVARLRAGVDRVEPGGFDLVPAATAAEADRSVRTRHALGALVLDPPRQAVLATAGADGVAVQRVLSQAFGRSPTGTAVRQVDLVPLPAGDRAGQTAFVLEIGLLIPSLVGSVGLHAVGRGRRIWWRVAAAVGFAGVAAALGVAVTDAWLGALTGAPWALFGLAALAAFTFMTVLAALQTLLGTVGSAVGALLLVVGGNPLNGSSVPDGLLPGGVRTVAAWLPNGAAVRAFTSAVYFGGHGAGQAVAALLLWTGGALLVLVTADLAALRARRRLLVPATA